MRILVLAPQPFFQERGTPIAVKLLVQQLAQRKNYSIDLLTYHEGADITIEAVHHHRITMPRWIGKIGPGVSLRKLLCDISFSAHAFRLIREARRSGKPFDLVHAVEESVFLAWLLKFWFKIPYVYDMDSVLSEQLIQKWRFLTLIAPLLRGIEGMAVRGSEAVVAVCDSLAQVASGYGAERVHLLPDVSLLNPSPPSLGSTTLREELTLSPDTPVVLYIGNLEPYQGIDLLIRSFLEVVNHSHETARRSHLIVIGGNSLHIEQYKALSDSLGLQETVHFLGPRPITSLHELLVQATVLVSPRILGNNTPMKLYSYLHSGVPIMATDLSTHTQVLTPTVACLAPPEPEQFGRALGDLLANQDDRLFLGKSAQALAERSYTLSAFSARVSRIFDSLEQQLALRDSSQASEPVLIP